MNERIGNKAPDWGHKYDLTELWTEVVPGLWVGGTHDNDTVDIPRDAVRSRYRFNVTQNAEITKREFDAVITLYAWARPVDWHVEELRTAVMDGNPTSEEIEMVREAAAWGYKRWKAGKRVLVRCQAGLNRSSLVTTLILMLDGYRVGEAVQAIRGARSTACLFNEEFVRFLIDEQIRKDDAA